MPARYPLRWKPLFRLFSTITVILLLLYIFSYRSKAIITISHFSDIREVLGSGPGEMGSAVHAPNGEKMLIEQSYRLYGFNQHVSDKISVNRSLADVRNPLCFNKEYKMLPVKVSVVIVFYDEGWSTLIRTAMSVINRSPKELLHEIILIDDYSTMDHLKKPLENYAKNFNGLIKVVRSPEHQGLIRARIRGADASTGDIIIFLDSHCEANKGWLQPLIYPITIDYRAVTCPTIDGIEHDTFEYKPYGETARGTFSWQFHYKEKPLNEEQKRKRASIIDPVPSPVMAGGLFAISSKWWIELGKYDPGLYIWGGEQYELSFKLWMCGGSMYNIPCSRVGHVYRGPGLIRNDQGINAKHPRATDVNHKRVAEVWMDDYKYFLYSRRPNIENALNYDYELNQRHILRKNLKCHDFRWYLENVVTDTLNTAYEPDRVWSKFINKGSYSCILISEKKLKLADCLIGNNLRWTWINEIREEEHCMDSNDGKNLKWIFCHEHQGNQRFTFDSDNKMIISSGSQKCLSYNEDNELTLVICDLKDINQKWDIKFNNLNIQPLWAKSAINFPRKP